jgi:hypothetical protein
MARVNLSEARWFEFRALAIREKRSVATYLGRLVEKEIGRLRESSSGAPSDRSTPRRRLKSQRPSRSRSMTAGFRRGRSDHG